MGSDCFSRVLFNRSTKIVSRLVSVKLGHVNFSFLIHFGVIPHIWGHILCTHVVEIVKGRFELNHLKTDDPVGLEKMTSKRAVKKGMGLD